MGQSLNCAPQHDCGSIPIAVSFYELYETIMGKYHIDMSKEGVIGEGSFSICRRGRILATGEEVAIKLYKDGVGKSTLLRFKRQVEVLKELQTPFKPPADPKLWTSQLEVIKPDKLFVRLIDYSKDAYGQPGPSVAEGELFVITEIAQYDLKSYIQRKKKHYVPPSKETVRDIAMAIVLVVAGLHAKGLVHLDLKPANLMFFNGCLKLIDVDGCVRIGTGINMDTSHVSFSPCYCAPEWAGFVADGCTKDDDVLEISAAPGLDSWSVGCTLCELVALDAIFRPAYLNCISNCKNNQEKGGLHFMEWLMQLQKAPIPQAVQRFDAELVHFIHRSLLVCDQAKRKTCAESLADPYLAADRLQRTKSSPIRTSWPVGVA